MRKTSYALTALLVAVTTILTVVALTRTDWVVAKYSAFESTYVAKYGLQQTCQRLVINLPGGGSKFDKLECRKFPDRKKDDCKDNEYFCAAWNGAGYATEVSIGFGVLSFLAIIVGVSTHSRRRRIWRAVAGLVTIHAILQLVAFALVTDLYRTSGYPTFEDAKLGSGIILAAISWVLGVLTAISVILTGVAADQGKRWAAGNRAYQPIN
ncbi:hypothetical protein FB45DRAFT_781970 [Roridomyces roridus]|uniref:Uncharacterized protein n=1 Tax=Roridomyces roridus TaxID=1738132 RepID=A0AAD7G0H4_9AGAR|nr:hypothetical protein FB45DRAFT_781970 [Roridomyces roridus]